MTKTVIVYAEVSPRVFVHETAPNLHPITGVTDLSSAALNLTQDNCPLSILAVSDFSFFQEKNSSEKGAIFFFFNWWSFPKYSTISLLSDPLATEESKRGPVINDMTGKLSAEGTLIFLYLALSNPYYENNKMLVSLAFICCPRNVPYETSLGNLDNFSAFFGI